MSIDNGIRIILPSPLFEQRRYYTNYDIVEQYRQQYYKEHGDERWFEDTRFFVHDPDWNCRFISIQCAHDGNHPVWAASHVLVRIGAVGWALSPLVFLL